GGRTSGPQRPSPHAVRIGQRAELLGTALLVLLGTKRVHGADQLRRERLEHLGSLGLLALEGTRQLGEQNLAGLEVRELLDLVGGHRLAVKDTALDDEIRVVLGEVTKTLRRLHRVTGDEGDCRRTVEQVVQRRDPGLVGRNLGQRVLHHGVLGVLTERTAQLLELSHGETAVLGQHGSAGVAELVRQLGHCGSLVGPRHRASASFRVIRTARTRRRTGENETPRRRRTGRDSTGSGTALRQRRRPGVLPQSPARVVRSSAVPSATAPSYERTATTSGLWLPQESTGTDRREANPLPRPCRRRATGGGTRRISSPRGPPSAPRGRRSRRPAGPRR